MERNPTMKEVASRPILKKRIQWVESLIGIQERTEASCWQREYIIDYSARGGQHGTRWRHDCRSFSDLRMSDHDCELVCIDAGSE